MTGTTGFLMGWLVRKAIYWKEEYQFASLDRVSDNGIGPIYWNKNHSFHIADIRDKHIMDVIFQVEQPEIVIHGAAEISDPDAYHSSNVLGTRIIIDACLKHKVSKLIYISDGKVYGQNNLPTEEAPINPITPYSVSKVAGEDLVKDAQRASGLIYNIIRLSNSYGPRQNVLGVIPRVVRGILQEKKIVLSNDGSTIRDWTHVFDHCSGILTVLNNGQPNETYNISANQELTDIEIAWKICNIMNKGHNLITYDKMPDFGDPLLNNEKIKKIGWMPKYKLKDGLLDTINWFNINQWSIR